MSWTIEQLVEFFERRHIPVAAYSIYAEQDEAYCLERRGNEWLIYYSERGQRRELGWAKSESQALNILKLFVLEGCGHLSVAQQVVQADGPAFGGPAA